MAALAVGPDTHVTLSYVLFDEQGEPVDRATDREPLTYVHGYAQIVPALERGLEGLKAGERREITVSPVDGFGEHDEEAVFEVDKESFPNRDDVAAGDEFVAEGPEGPIAMRVVEVLEDAFVVDTNHPLAGQTVRFEVEVKDVRPASEDEIAQAQADLEQRVTESAHACCGPDGHDHEHHHHGDESLVSLSRKK